MIDDGDFKRRSKVNYIIACGRRARGYRDSNAHLPVDLFVRSLFTQYYVKSNFEDKIESRARQ